MTGTSLANLQGMTEEGWLTDSWYFAAPSRAVKPGAQIRRMVLGQPVMLARTAKRDGAGGHVFALRDVCPHRFVPLSAGRQTDTHGEPTIECPYHGWRFGADGGCRLIPSIVDPDPAAVARIRVRKYHLYEAGGIIFIHVASDPRDADAPAPPAFALPAGQPASIRVDTLVGGHDDHLARVLAAPGAGDSEFLMPGWRIDRDSAQRTVTLTCLTPASAATTQIARLVYRGGGPLAALAEAIRGAPHVQSASGAAPDLPDWYLAARRDWASRRDRDAPAAPHRLSPVA